VVTSFSEGDQVKLGRTVFTLRNHVQAVNQENNPPQVRTWTGKERRANERRDVGFIIEVAQLLAGKTMGIQETLDRALDHLLGFLKNCDRAIVFVFLPDQNAIKSIAVRSRLNPSDATLPYSHPAAEQTIHKDKIVRLSEVDNETTEDLGDLRPLQIRSVFCAPLYKSSKPRGALYVDSIRRPHDFPRRDLVMLESVCTLLSSYFEKLEF